jgi:hypothetical protein
VSSHRFIYPGHARKIVGSDQGNIEEDSIVLALLRRSISHPISHQHHFITGFGQARAGVGTLRVDVATSDSPTSTVYGGRADKFCHRLQAIDEEDMIEGWANESSDQG